MQSASTPTTPTSSTPTTTPSSTPTPNSSTTLLENLAYAGESIKVNFISWVFVFAAIYVLSEGGVDYGYAILTFVLIMLLSHIVHYLAHFTFAYPLNIVHIYHHKHQNFFSHFIQAVLEFAFPFSVIAWKYMMKFLLEVEVSFINFWVVFLYYLFYTTVHNINYGVFRVNDVHALHHKLFVKNMGPDICDIAFGTKHEVQKGVEKTWHYIPNIVLATGAVYAWKQFYTSSAPDMQALFQKIGMGLYGAAAVTLIGVTGYLYAHDRTKLFYRNYTDYYGTTNGGTTNGGTTNANQFSANQFSASANANASANQFSASASNQTNPSDGQAQLRCAPAGQKSETTAL